MNARKRILTVFMVTACLLFMVSPRAATAAEKPEVFVQIGHAMIVRSVAFSPDGKYAVSGSADGSVKLWDVASAREIRTFLGHEGSVNRVLFGPKGEWVISAGENKSLRLWEVETGREIRVFRGHSAAVYYIALSRDGRFILSGSQDKTMKLWEVYTGREIRTFRGHKEYVGTVAISPDGLYVLSGSIDKTMRLWDITTGKEIRKYFVHKDYVYDVAFSSDGKQAISASADKTLRLWDMKMQKVIRVMQHDSPVSNACFSPDGKHILTSGFDQKIRLWNSATGQEEKTFEQASRVREGFYTVTSIAFSPDGRYVLSGSQDRTMRLWEVASGREVRVFMGNTDTLRAVALSPDGKWAATGGIGRTLTLWDLQAGREIRRLSGHQDTIYAAVFSRDGKHVLSGGSDCALRLWETGTGHELESLRVRIPCYVKSVALSPDGRHALSGGLNKTLLSGSPGNVARLWELASGKEIRILEGHKGGVDAITYSPDGKRILSGSFDKTLKLWDAENGREIRTYRGHTKGVQAVAFSPDGKSALSGGGDATVRLWDVQSGREIRSFRGHAAAITSVAYGPDGRKALSGSYDKMIRLWDLESGKEMHIFRGHVGFVNAVAMDGIGRTFLSVSGDGTLKLWDLSSGREMATLVSFAGGDWVVITPEGYFNASPGGAQHLNVRVRNRVYSIDQFYAKFFRPELVQLALAGREILQGETLGDVLARRPAPDIRVLSPISGASVEADSISISLSIRDNGGGIGNVYIYLNGTQVANETRGVTIQPKETDGERVLKAMIPLLAGRNEIRAVAFNQDNSMESNPAVITIVSRMVPDKPDLHALVIGINEYRNTSISLNHAVSDAGEFAETLQRAASPLFRKTDIVVLTKPDETTREAITGAFEVLRGKIRPSDLFVFYNASHGIVDVVDDEEQYYLLTSNVLLLSSRHIKTEAIGQKELAGLIGGIPAQKKLVILDTCNAGKGGKEIQASLLRQTRGLTDTTAVKLLHRAIGSAVFAASSDTQVALEGYQGHGLFTYVLMEGLKGKADVKKDGYITVLGLADYVEEHVIKLSEKVFRRQQAPTIQTGANFPIGKVR